MDTWVVFQQMLVLFAMMAVGYFSYRLNWLDDASCSKLSTIIVQVLNPAVIINGVLGKNSSAAGALIGQNLLLIILMFVFLILISRPLAALLRVPKKEKNQYRLMTIFANVGLMGIPVVSSIYGPEALIFVSFYILVYNVLIYTLGIRLAAGGNGVKLEWKKILNTGVIACLIAVVLFTFHVETPETVNTFMNYMGTAAIPMSMFVIGASIAQADMKSLFGNVKLYLFAFLKMVCLPLAGVFLLRPFSFDPTLVGIFLIMLSMPVGSIVSMIVEEYGEGGSVGSQGVVLTSVLCVVTLPVVSLFF